MRSLAYCLLAGLLLPVIAHAADADAQAAKAQSVLRANCFGCHGQDGTAKGGFDYVLDRTKLVAQGKVTPGQPEESELYQRVRDNEMPPSGVKQRPSMEERALLKKWIEAGAPSASPTAAHTFLSENAVLQLMRDDLHALEPAERRFARYFTLTIQSNAGVDGDTLQATRHALAKLLNSLSWHPRITRPIAIDAEQTIYRIDLRAYRWNVRNWERLQPVYPYRGPVDKAIATATGSDLPCIRADWFIATASRPPLYHDLLRLPERDKALERQLGVDVLVDLQEGNVARAGFNGSGVSKNNRVIERHDANYGAFWRSYDFYDNTERQNIFDHPLGPTPGQNGFLHAGGEIIFHLPNGLQAYLLVDANGRRVDKAPNDIVSDPKRPDRQVENGLSCMTCHVRGLLPKADQVRAHVAKNSSSFTRSDVEKIRALYPPDAKMRGLMKEDIERFVKALEKVDVPVDEPEPISAVTARYEATLDLPNAAAEVGLTSAEFTARLRKSPGLARSLGPLLVKGGTVQRSAFQAVFDDAMATLRPKEAEAIPAQPFTGHTDAVLCIGLAADGKTAVSGSQDKTLRLWHLVDGKETRRFEGHTDAVTCVAFAPNGRILSGSRDRTLRLWDATSDEQVRLFKGHTDTVRCVACSPDGKRVVSGSLDGTLRIWDIDTAKEVRLFPRQEGGIFSVAFSADGSRIVSGDQDGGVCLWNADGGKPLQRLKGHTGEVFTIVFSGDGRRLLTGGNDRTARLWDLAEAKELARFEGHGSAILAAAFVGEDVLSGTSLYQGTDAPLRLWQDASGKERRSYRADDGEQIWCLAFSKDGRLALSAGAEHRLRLWQLDR
ncbi:MAG TPA: c-type cytochrome domain-containing protein [Gemmataceae bacterium]|jgi:mono/diheme cytochrome c family protein